jgi:DNA-directed RNA polymerase subunit alpha
LLIAQLPKLTEEVIDSQRSKFVIEPLEPGFGFTLGNSLRRTLLSSIPGTAVTSIKIGGVLHEYSVVDGVKEDVEQIILNVKNLVVSSEFDEPVVVYLNKTGKGPVLAGEIEVPTGVVIHNPKLQLCTLNDSANFTMEFIVERGRGYVSSEQNKQIDAEIGRIPVDSIYSPVLKVNFKVDATRVEQRTDFDKLTLDVITKENISPRNAMASAGSTLIELFGLVRELNTNSEGIELGDEKKEEIVESNLLALVEELHLSQRSLNCLKREQINTIGELIARSERDLKGIKNFGQKSIDEVVEKLRSFNLSLKTDIVVDYNTLG